MRIFPRIIRYPFRVFRGDETSNAANDQLDLLLVSHEASRTGAPLIALNLLRNFTGRFGLQCGTLFNDGGPLISEFAQISRVECLNTQRCESTELTRKVQRFLHLSGGRPRVAVCNSMESRFIAAELARAGIPVVSLVHEMASSYTESDFHLINAASQLIVFPCEAVAQAAQDKVPLSPAKIRVYPQGLLRSDFGNRVERQTARQALRAELGLMEGSRIVLGCGTLDMRKGIDHFAAIGREYLRRHPGSNVYFVWMGDGPTWTHSVLHYVKLDLERSGAAENVKFIGERIEVEQYFMGADVFLLSSRVDPFPCVVHEAMAAGLPVVTFDGSGGAAEAIGGEAGFAVPFGDYSAGVSAIHRLLNDSLLYQRMRSAAQSRVFENYRFDDYAERIWSLCRTLMDLPDAIARAA